MTSKNDGMYYLLDVPSHRMNCFPIFVVAYNSINETIQDSQPNSFNMKIYFISAGNDAQKLVVK